MSKEESKERCPKCKSPNIGYAEYGAPGVGGTYYCEDCDHHWGGKMRIMEPWEVR